MKSNGEYVPRIVLAVAVAALFGVQWAFGDFPMWLFAAPMNLLVGALWLVVLWEGYRRRERSAIVRYMLSAEATYTSLAVAAVAALVLGLQSVPASASWPAVGGYIFVLTHLTFVILRGWRDKSGVRLRFVVLHGGIWLAMASMLFGAPDKQILRMELGSEPCRMALDERGDSRLLDYELSLAAFDVQHYEDGSPQRFCATVRVDGEEVDIEVNSPYSPSYGEDIYLVSYDAKGCILQIVREPWRAVTATGVAMLLLGAFMMFMQGFRREER